jgi:hypothetical protein
MKVLQVNILCNKDERDEEDLKVEAQMKDMGIKIDDKVVQEWRSGFIIIDHIEAFYPHGKKPEYTLMHMTSNNVITLKESVDDIIELLNKLNNSPNEQYKHSYTAIIGTVPEGND